MKRLLPTPVPPATRKFGVVVLRDDEIDDRSRVEVSKAQKDGRWLGGRGATAECRLRGLLARWSSENS